MKICLFNTSEIIGGAAKSVYRLHESLIKQGVESTLIVQNKTSDSIYVKGPTSKWQKTISSLQPTFDQIPNLIFCKKGYHFSSAWFPTIFGPHKKIIKETQLIHLNWINKGFIQIETLQHFSKPIIWTLHDMWPFTGGCHHSFECDGYKYACGNCPQLSISYSWDISNIIWRRKKRVWKDLDITFVCPSQWMANIARQSSLLNNKPIEVIANGINLEFFSPGDRKYFRKRIGFHPEKKIILFNAINMANNPYKGFNFIDKILEKLHNLDWDEKIELALIGTTQPIKKYFPNLPVHYFGNLRDEISLSVLYSSTDLYIAPSIIDNLPNTIIEALACGIPCVAFNVGGIADQIDHKVNGYLAVPYEIEDFATGIDWVLKDEQRWNELSKNARMTAEKKFDIRKQTKTYVNLYRKIINQDKD